MKKQIGRIKLNISRKRREIEFIVTRKHTNREINALIGFIESKVPSFAYTTFAIKRKRWEALDGIAPHMQLHEAIHWG